MFIKRFSAFKRVTTEFYKMRSQGFLRQRRSGPKQGIQESSGVENGSMKKEEVVWGKTPGGQVFRVPTTHDVIKTLFDPSYPKSHLDFLTLALLGFQIALFLTLSRKPRQIFFFLNFAFWRGTYDAGLGWVLTKQSKKKWIEKEVQRLGWLDEKRRPGVRNWIRKQLVVKMEKDYSFDDLPLEYNTWLLFRQAVDVILVNDFLSYCLFAFSCFRVPEDLSLFVHIMRWLGGIALIAFNLWVKTEAHNVVKDYGWYWGDCFFQRGALVFDGVFELAPHPMYSVGYAGYYGLSLISGSYPVLFVSLAGHAAQFAFLVFFENPHIERLYGKKKVISKRTPLFQANKANGKESSSVVSSGTSVAQGSNFSTPAITEGETATETDLETETEMDDEMSSCTNIKPLSNRAKLSKHRLSHSIDGTVSSNGDTEYPNSKPRSRTVYIRRQAVSQHDLLNKYFRRDAVVLRNIDLLRATDAMLILIIFYGVILSLLPNLSFNGSLVLHFLHALLWCILHYYGLGLLLRAQSESKFLVRHYLKNYFYNDHSDSVIEAFSNWKAIYNMSMCMTYLSFLGLAWKAYNLPKDWTVGSQLLRHTLGIMLLALHAWAALESYEVLGIFGWFFGDFFMEDFPSHLEYTGIYRYLNHPEAMGGASYLGIALVCSSKLVLALAVIRHLANWWFLKNVELPHMRKLYGDSLRKDSGFIKVMKSVATRNAKILESRAGKHAPELKRVAKEVIGTFDKVYEETAEAVEDFLARSAPRISEVVEDTKVLLRQSREKLVISRVANDLSSFDTSKYSLSIIPSKMSGKLAFHLGEHITVRWQSPHEHSRKDWIGLYRVGANKMKQVTKTSSMGMWLPVHEEEWDGDVPVGHDRFPLAHRDELIGNVTFDGNNLPWVVGRYEVRYHHDGKYNVLSLDGPLEIYVDKPKEVNFTSVRDTLKHIVPLCLDEDPLLIPLSCKIPQTIPMSEGGAEGEADSVVAETESDQEDRDPDDFSFWSESQAKRICGSIKQIFDVDYSPEVVVADANLTTLANRILVSKKILSGP